MTSGRSGKPEQHFSTFDFGNCSQCMSGFRLFQRQAGLEEEKKCKKDLYNFHLIASSESNLQQSCFVFFRKELPSHVWRLDLCPPVRPPQPHGLAVHIIGKGTGRKDLITDHQTHSAYFR